MYFSDLDPETGGPHNRKCMFHSICLWSSTPNLGQLFQVSLSFSKTLPWSMYNLRHSLQTSWSFNNLFQKISRRWPRHVRGKLSASSWRLQFEGPSLMKIQYRQPELHWGLSAFTMGEGEYEAPTIPFRRTTAVSSCWGEEASFSSVSTDVLCLLPNNLPPTFCHAIKLGRLCTKGRQEHSGGLLRSVPGRG